MTNVMKSNFIHVCFIIDESSSMYDSMSDVKAGFKKIINEQKANKEGTCAITIYKFRTVAPPAEIIMKDVNDVSENLEYNPNGCTALYDGVGRAIREVGQRLYEMPEEERPEKNLIVIMTDGYENSSRSYNAAMVKEMIKHQEEKYNWTFLYIGTDISNAKDADNMGISRKFATTRGKIDNSYDTINSVLHCYRNTTGSAQFKGVTMDSYLSAEITANNAEYKADTGIDIK